MYCGGALRYSLGYGTTTHFTAIEWHRQGPVGAGGAGPRPQPDEHAGTAHSGKSPGAGVAAHPALPRKESRHPSPISPRLKRGFGKIRHPRSAFWRSWRLVAAQPSAISTRLNGPCRTAAFLKILHSTKGIFFKSPCWPWQPSKFFKGLKKALAAILCLQRPATWPTPGVRARFWPLHAPRMRDRLPGRRQGVPHPGPA